MKHKDYLIGIIPALFALPLLTAIIPIGYHAMRESAQYFQTLALLRTGFEAHRFWTPFESMGGLELYGMLNVPALALGYTESGRLLSLVSAVIAAILLMWIAYTLTEQRTAAIFTGLSLWVQPLFFRHAYTYTPEALSIALTVGAVATTLKYIKSHDYRWYAATLLVVLLGVVNHTWEAIVLLPTVGLLVQEREYLLGGLLSVVGVVAVIGMRTLIYTLQQPEYTYSGTWSIVAVGPEFLRVSWWTGFLHSLIPFEIFFALMIPISIILLLWWTSQFVNTRSRLHLLVTTWLASGLAIPFLIPGALPWHRYYLWGLIAPLALSSGLLAMDVKQRLLSSLTEHQVQMIYRSMVVLLILSVGVNGLVIEAGLFHKTGIPIGDDISGTAQFYMDGSSPREAAAAGRAIRDGEYDGGKVVFVGDWTTEDAVSWDNPIRVMVYSGILIRDLRIIDSETVEVSENKQISDCEYRVIRRGTEIETKQCTP